MVYDLMTLTWKLCPYFQDHLMIVLMDQLMKTILQRPKTLDQLAKWLIKLDEFNLEFQSWHAIKVQLLTDFILECTIPKENQPKAKLMKEILEEARILYVDGSSSLARCGIGLVVTSPKVVVMEYAMQFEFQILNNEIDYEAFITGLKITKVLGV